MKLLDKPRNIKIIKRRTKEKVYLYHIDWFKVVNGKVFAINMVKMKYN